MATRILIRHLVGSKINQVEQFPIESFPELSIGREPGATIVFSSPRDDAVSRKHAVIKVIQGDPPSFRLSDLGSSNGTFLNGERITREAELLPGDTIELGSGGPKFTFDLEPRPINLPARTRIASVAGSPATRVIDVVEATPLPPATFVPTPFEAKPSVGRETVMRLLSEQKQATSRVGLYALAGVLAVILLAGGAIYYKNQRDVAEEATLVEKQNMAQNDKSQELAAQIQQQKQMLPTLVHQQIGENAREIADKYSNSTVVIDMQWGLYDRETGKPLYHKTFRVPGQDHLLPAYVEWNNRLYRWLITEDEGHTNTRVGSGGKGTGFVIDGQGFILTNKHLASGWNINYNAFADYENGVGVIFDTTEKIPSDNSTDKKQREIYDKFMAKHYFNISTRPNQFHDLISWFPDNGGPVFEKNQPRVISNNSRTFEGSNEQLEVRFPGARMNMNARLVRASTDADVALIKIDVPENLVAIPLAVDDNVKIGAHVSVLGYPDFSVQNVAEVSTIEKGEFRKRREEIPQPTVTEGIISTISLPQQQVGNLTIAGSMGHVYQMTVSAARGNSGGPVFDTDGKVIGLFTYGSSRETNTFAVPIKYARDLLQTQRTF
jgi:serine protease Do